MKRLLVILAVILLGSTAAVKADEGMWLPLFVERLNYVDMQKMGLQLTADEIYSINHSSLKDAIIIFGGGCTGEIVSPEGLIFTNHHCGYGQIQSHSTIEHDYLTDGFWAMSKKEELPNDGLTARFLVRIEDVTDQVLSNLNDNMTEQQRSDKVREVSRAITDKAIDGTGYEGAVRGFFAGNEYYLFVYEIFRDVRLVGAPPSSIGKYGADTDNWMWPRHTGDFSIFRVYTGPDGKPANYAQDNVPMKSKYYLPVSIKGVEKDDFAMIMGYPGGTERYLSSWGAQLAEEESNMTVVNIRAKKLEIMRRFMDADPAVRIDYASKYAGTSNYWKFFIGQTKGLKNLKVYDKKLREEAAFDQWVNADAARQAKYGDALKLREQGIEAKKAVNLTQIYLNEAVSRGSEILMFSRRFKPLADLLEAKDKDQEAIDKEIAQLRVRTANYFDDYYQPLDQALLSTMLFMYYQNVPKQYQPEMLAKVYDAKQGFEPYVNKFFNKTIFASRESVNAMLDQPSAKKIMNDPATELMKAFMDIMPQIREVMNAADEKQIQGERLYISGLRQMFPDRKFYPDANFTMRLTYGQVLDYYPADAIHYDYYTTLSGVMQKEDPSTWEFKIPEKLKQLYQNKDFGRYGKNGEMVVNFLTTNDITGGNSGSPVMNAKGELIGLAFDGNWEAMSGDIAFEPDLQRTICIDIRYVLFIIDKFAGAKNIIDELNIVSD
ncbi:MAG TPA: S46 family peptidase [Bacteroidales bacterium]|nr:S46 family peptidase [Bacteroidales bacterium]